ncbi:hypothetical protein D3C87_2123660 [compost metagenome]
MPNSSAIAVITISGTMPCSMVSARKNSRPNQITISSAARFIQWRPGSNSGLPPILPLSLPKAISDPLNVMAPIRMPT